MPCVVQYNLVLTLVWIICRSHIAAPQNQPPEPAVTTESTTTTVADPLNFHALLKSQLAASRARPPPKVWPTAAAFPLTISAVRWREAIERLLEVRCHPDRMTVLLHYERNYSRLPLWIVDVLQRGVLYTEPAGRESAGCSSASAAMIDEDGALSLKFDYDDCGVEMGRGPNDTIIYSISVIVEANINLTLERAPVSLSDQPESEGQHVRERYRFRCVHPYRRQPSDETIKFSLLLSGEKYPQSYWTMPKNIELGGLIYLYSEAVSPWFKEKGLYSFPVNCWTSPNQDSSANSGIRQTRRKLFVKDGCPVNDARGRGLSHIHHFKDGPTKVSVHLGEYLLFEDEYPENDQSSSTRGPAIDRRTRSAVSITCEVVPCVQSFTFGLLNIPKCPLSYFCAGIPQLNSALPMPLRSIARTAITAGPISIKDKNEVERPVRANVSCQMACQQIMGNKEARTSAVRYVEGVRPQIVIMVALVSFLFGLVVMGAMWFIHEKTDHSKALLIPAEGELIQSPDAALMHANHQIQVPSWHISRIKQPEHSTTETSSEPPPRTPHSGLLHPFRMLIGSKSQKKSAAISQSAESNGSNSAASALLTCCASKNVETGESIANTDAATASRLLNTLR